MPPFASDGLSQGKVRRGQGASRRELGGLFRFERWRRRGSAHAASSIAAGSDKNAPLFRIKAN